MASVRKPRKDDRKTRTTRPARSPITSSPGPAGAYAAETAAYASPPCFMHEVDPNYLGYMDKGAVLALLNEMLEGERAGAKVAGALRKYAADPRTETVLLDVWIDEARFCAMLRRHIGRLGGTPSRRTGAFYEKVLALKSMDERLTLLNKGQAWVVRKLRDTLPKISDEPLRTDLEVMLDVHEKNIERCARSLL